MAADPRRLADTVQEARPSVPDVPCLMCQHDYCECRTDQVKFDGALDALVSLAEQLQQDYQEYLHAYTDANEARESAERELALTREASASHWSEFEHRLERAESAEAAVRAAQARAEEAEKALMRRVLDAEAIDNKHGFALPGDSALAVLLGGFEEHLGRAVLAASPQAGEHQTQETA